MIVAVTGTRTWRPFQNRLIIPVLQQLPEDATIVNGGCKGVDAFIAGYWHGLGRRVHTVLPYNMAQVEPWWRNHCDSHVQMGADKPEYRDRNIALLEDAELLLAFPQLPEHHGQSQRSGTWMTVRLARARGIPIRTTLIRGF